MDGAGDGGTGHAVQLGQCRVRQLQAQVDQGDQDPVGEDQLVFRPSSSGPLALPAPSLAQLGLAPCQPRAGQLLDQNAEMCTIKAAEDRMGQGGTGQVMRYNITNPRGPRHVTSRHGRPAAAAA